METSPPRPQETSTPENGPGIVPLLLFLGIGTALFIFVSNVAA